MKNAGQRPAFFLVSFEKVFMENSIHHKKSVVHYSKTGNGPKPLLAFHGFGQNKEVFNELAKALSNKYTLYCFDLFFHGKSEWSYDEQTLKKEFWKHLLNQFLTKHNIESFSVLGFSIGSKFALATLETYPGKVKEIFLLAPDGITTNVWYWLATYPTIGRRLFKSMIFKPGRFESIISVALKLGVIDKSVAQFASLQMNTEEKRKQVYYSWIVLRNLKFDMTTISEIINSNNIDTMIITGRNDKIITPKKIYRLLRRIRACKFEVIEAGHNNLIRKSIPLIQSKMEADTKSNW